MEDCNYCLDQTELRIESEGKNGPENEVMLKTQDEVCEILTVRHAPRAGLMMIASVCDMRSRGRRT